jgi:phytoene desaturase
VAEPVVVIGAGVGGLACATRLAAAGRRVELFERNDVLGGKMARAEHDGFRFDVGPSLLTLPALVDDVLRTAGVDDALDLVRLDPQFRYHWPDGAALDVADRPQDTARAFGAFGAASAWRRFDARGARIWEVSERTFLAGPMSSPRDLLRRMRSPRDLTAIDPLRTLHAAAAATFADPHLVQWAGRYATYSGSSPFRAPATLACIPHIESRFGCWHPRGGMDAVRAALELAARHAGVEIRAGAEVAAVLATGDRVRAVELADGSIVPAAAVVAGVDAEHLYADLLADDDALGRVRRAPRSTSGFAVAAAVRGRTAGIAHHNVWFSGDDRAEFAALEAGRSADEPTVYACVSAVSDRSQAPDGDENWFLLVNEPAGADVDPDARMGVVLERLAAHGVDLRGRILWHTAMTPADFAARTGAPGGAIYGTSSDGRRAAFLRPANRGSRRGLYLVGGSAHPGGGVPLVLTGARIVAGLVLADVAAP